MQIVKCDICGNDMSEEVENYDIDFASIEDRDIRLLFDCDICGKCLQKAYHITYSAIKTHLYNNVKIQGTWNNFNLIKKERE